MKYVWGISEVLVLLSVSFPAAMLWLLKIFVQCLWNEAQILTGSSGVIYSSKQSMVLRASFWTMPKKFYSLVLVASACTARCGRSRDTGSTLPVGHCSLGMEGASARSASQGRSFWKKSSAWVASTSEIFPLYLMESHSDCPGCVSKCFWSSTERELQRLG